MLEDDQIVQLKNLTQGLDPARVTRSDKRRPPPAPTYIM